MSPPVSSPFALPFGLLGNTSPYPQRSGSTALSRLVSPSTARPAWSGTSPHTHPPSSLALSLTLPLSSAINGNATGQDLNAFVSAAEAATTIVYPSTILSGVNDRWTHSYFDIIACKLARQLQALPAHLKPDSTDRLMAQGWSFDYAMVARTWFIAVLVHSENLEDH